MLIALLIVAGIVLKHKNGEKIMESQLDISRLWDYAILSVPTICYVIMIAKVAPYDVDRYVMGTFGLIILCFLLLIKGVMEFAFANKGMMKSVGMLLICITTLVSINQAFHISYLSPPFRNF